jgi:hypothetical protein
MRAIPNWFKRELRNIDPRLEIEYDQHYNFFNIYITVDLYLYDKGKKIHIRERLLKACFRDLNEKAMSELRERHWIAQRFNARGDGKAYLRQIQSNNREAKKKQKKLAADMIVEGMKKIYESGTKQTYDMGGVA